ncbi:hypothetical protein ABPG74_020047 [Tetrahymena malaccensis]
MGQCQSSKDDLSVQIIESNSIQGLSLKILKRLTAAEFSNKDTKLIRDTLSNCHSLSCLTMNFDYSGIIDKEFIQLVNSIKNCSKITNLSLQIRYLSGYQIYFLLDSLQDLEYLNELNLDFEFSYLRDQQAIQLENNNKITKLSLNFDTCSIFDKEIQFITSILQNYKLITHLKIQLGLLSLRNNDDYFSQMIYIFQKNNSPNNIGDQGIRYLCQSIEKIQDLIQLNLNLNLNHIGPMGAQQIAICLQKYQNLSNLSLHLAGCQLELEGVKHIVESLEKCKKIVTLDLSFNMNNIGPIGAQQISFCLQNCLNLSNLSLSLSNCFIELEGIRYIVESLENYKKIVTLDLYITQDSVYYLDENYRQALIIELNQLEKRISKIKRLTTKSIILQ